MTYRKRFGVGLVSGLLATCCHILLMSAVAYPQDKTLQLDALVQNLAERGQFSGSILVSEHGKVIYQRGFGAADRSKSIPFSANTPSYLASLAKQFTAMGIMMLEEQHKLGYEDPLSKYFPGFP